MKKENENEKQYGSDKKSVPEEKSRVGGDYNSGVTSEDPAEKEQIEKQGSLGKHQPKSQKERDAENKDVLTKENLPDATNEAKGKMGSGQRQDSN